MTTMNLREAAQQAIGVMANARDFLEDVHYKDPTEEWNPKQQADELQEALFALRAALAEPVQPVAWMCPEDPERETAFNWKAGHCENCGKQRVPLYAAPQQRKPLTDEEMRDLWSWSMTPEAERTATTQQHAFARAIEAAHGIKGGSDGS